MTTPTDRIIDSLAALHESHAGLVAGLSDEQLTAQSGAADWKVADVLSHLGSGAEMMAPRLAAALGIEPAHAVDNQVVWDRWNAATPREQAEQFVERDAFIVDLAQSATSEQRDTARVDLGFLPAPVPLAVAAGMRLSEVAQHGWDFRYGIDPTAGVDADAALLLLDLLATDLSFLLGFSTKADALAEPAAVVVGDHLLLIDEDVSVRAGASGIAPTATFEGPAEAAVRLLSGRLRPDTTPDGVQVTGNVSLDDLRRVFPGY